MAEQPRHPAGSPKGGQWTDGKWVSGGYDPEDNLLSSFQEEAVSTWSSGDDAEIRNDPKSDMGTFFREAMDEIVPYHGDVYRGMSPRDAFRVSGLEPGDIMELPKFRSWSKEKAVAIDFSDPDDGDRTGVLLKVKGARTNFRDITPHMVEENQWGKEVVSMEGSRFKVVSVTKNVDEEFTVANPWFTHVGQVRKRKLHIIELEEIS